MGSNKFSTTPFDGRSVLDRVSEERVQVAETSPMSGPPGSPSSASTAALQRFIQAGDLSVVFQPIVRTATREVFAYEALVRCAVAEYRNPLRLFERAVQERCVGRLGRTIRSVAVPLCAGVPVFFNIHPLELSEHWLLRPDDPIYSHDEPIFLEITETVPLDHFSLCKSVLREIRARSDASLVVDDLGAGFSNLKYIADLEPAVVKLDRELVAEIHRQPRVQRLVHWLVRLCEDLGASVVAEGVETEDELSCVLDQGVQFVQGFLIARPAYPLPLLDTLRPDLHGRPRASGSRGSPLPGQDAGRPTSVTFTSPPPSAVKSGPTSVSPPVGGPSSLPGRGLPTRR